METIQSKWEAKIAGKEHESKTENNKKNVALLSAAPHLTRQHNRNSYLVGPWKCGQSWPSRGRPRCCGERPHPRLANGAFLPSTTSTCFKSSVRVQEEPKIAMLQGSRALTPPLVFPAGFFPVFGCTKIPHCTNCLPYRPARSKADAAAKFTFLIAYFVVFASINVDKRCG